VSFSFAALGMFAAEAIFASNRVAATAFPQSCQSQEYPSGPMTRFCDSLRFGSVLRQICGRREGTSGHPNAPPIGQ